MKVKQNMSPRRLLFASIGAAGVLMSLAPAFAYTGEQLSKEAKVSIAEARAIALKAHPGKIVDEELEREGGGIVRHQERRRHARGGRRRQNRARIGERQRGQEPRLANRPFEQKKPSALSLSRGPIFVFAGI
jgi:hypothetical protein